MCCGDLAKSLEGAHPLRNLYLEATKSVNQQECQSCSCLDTIKRLQEREERVKKRELHHEHGEWGVSMCCTYEGSRRMQNHNTSGDKVKGSVLFYLGLNPKSLCT